MASRGAGQIILKITLPCLMFSKIVPAFSTSNISALGPLFLVAIIYEAISMVMAWIVKQFFWVPHRFRYGIIMAGTWSNWADLPTAVVMSITAGPPFNPATDSNIAVAYVSAFIFVFFVSSSPSSMLKCCLRAGVLASPLRHCRYWWQSSRNPTF
ncbi:hypothetical protein NM688_g6347 [Phlebia brevispora]|uniref:Uncharacterized protein n=1 Tax=Phlebia brevispora TaxID=194682 RepID=A0ACC1SGZ8_9APHY|nr:hypothetical protein NM688_g6347 [Phlebia brevispora]